MMHITQSSIVIVIGQCLIKYLVTEEERMCRALCQTQGEKLYEE